MFLLPWSKLKSKADLVNLSFWETKRSFPEIDPLRKAVMEEFRVKEGPLAPVWRRYKGRFWEELCVWALPGRVRKVIEERGLVLSPLFGILSAGDLIPNYDLTWEDRYKGENLSSFWRKHLRSLVGELLRGKVVVDLLGRRERGVIEIPEDCTVVRFKYYRAGRKVRNTQAHRAYTLRYMVEMNLGLGDLHRINFLDYEVKEVREQGRRVVVILGGEGEYI